ncbi:MAG: response regulator [Eubacterium sp.]|nr:response regulator [Eubacterium sp.]
MASIFEELFSYISRNLNLLSPKENRQPDEKKKIMVIDDSPLMLRTISGMLNAHYKVATAISGKVAWRYLADNTADLIILDYEMPDENGPAVFKKLKENPLTADIPVIFLTSVNDVDKVCGVLSLQPEGYLLKPVDMADLMGKIEEALSRGEI